MIVADTNLLAYLLLDGEQTATAEQVLERDSHWTAPLLWRSELRNVLTSQIRQDLLALDQARHLMHLAETLMAGREYAVPSESVLGLAESSGCTAYDCEFVALAQQTGAPLVTADRQVLKAFPDIAVAPRQFVE